MEILKDTALVLKRKNVNDSSVSTVLFTKKNGKINAIAFSVRSLNKREKISLNPLSYIDVELKKTNDNYQINSYSMKKAYNNIYKNLDKLEIAMYVVYTLNKILIYKSIEDDVYNRVNKVLDYLNDLDNNKLKDKEFKNRILSSYLKKIMKDLGIYDEKINFENNFIKIEEYINNYFNLDIDYTKILIGGN